MCDFVVTHDGGQETALTDKYILVNADDNEVHSLGEWDIQSVESVSFGIGVDAAHNVGIDPTTYPDGHPLAPQQPACTGAGLQGIDSWRLRVSAEIICLIKASSFAGGHQTFPPKPCCLKVNRQVTGLILSLRVTMHTCLSIYIYSYT